MNNTIALEKPLDLKTWHLFVLLLIGVWINTWVIQNQIMTREVYHNLLSERLEVHRIDDYFNMMRKLSVWNYVWIPLFLWLRLTFVTLFMQFPLVFKFIDIPFKQIFRMVALAFIPLFFAGFIKTIWLLRQPANQITEEILAFVPFAITNFLEASLYPKAAFGFLSNFNIFEILWCIIIAKGLSSTGKLRKIDAALLVFIVWTLMVLFQWALMLYLAKVNS